MIDVLDLHFQTLKEIDKNRPLPARKMLNERQIKALINFIVDDIKGKPITKDYCLRFFGKPSRVCEEL